MSLKTSSLKYYFFLLFLCLLGCNKKAEVKPVEIAEKLVGKYSMSEIIAGGQTLKLPFKQNSNELFGTITIEKSAANEIKLSYAITTILEGVKETDTASDQFFIKQGIKDIEIFDDEKLTKQIGSLADGKTLYIVSGETDRITALKN